MKIKHDIYEDNLFLGTDCEEDTMKFYTALKQIFKRMDMKITKGKWDSTIWGQTQV